MVKKRLIAVIPARGGSKRIPHKNIRDFNGKPLIAWTIEAARNADIFERILVSTDDARIAEIARESGVEVPFLRDSKYDDHSPVSEATIAALTQVENKLHEHYEIVVQLMPSCPLRKSGDIINAWQNFNRMESSFQISCFKFGWMNPWWAVTIDGKGNPTPIFPDKIKARSQGLPDLYCPSGAIWIADIEPLKRSGTFYGPGHVFYPLEWRAAIDIDDRQDLEMAHALFKTEKTCELLLQG
jgi:CMP-N-acetylneuraminic acid synthetase